MTTELDLLHADGWTTDDLDALPEDGRRRELVDGVLLVIPSLTARHQTLTALLAAWLDRACPTGYGVTMAVEIRFDSQNSFTPDVLAVTAAAAGRNPSHFAPHEVVLAIEVVSQFSVAMDRVLKPALYAAAGIPCYWRIETEDDVVVHTHRLNPIEKIYVPTGEHTTIIEVDEPWPISIQIADIVGRGSSSTR